MKDRCLEYLACPECVTKLTLLHVLSRSDQEIETAILSCPECHREYPVLDSIPIISTDPALIMDPLNSIMGEGKHSGTLPAIAVKPSDSNSQQRIMVQAQLDHYTKFSQRYDKEVTSSPFWQAVQELTIVPWSRTVFLQSGKVLEIGCGTGRSTVALVSAGCRVVATDLCLEAVRQARASVSRLGPNLAAIDFVVCNAESLPFLSDTFNACIFTGVLHHVVTPEHAIESMARVMSRGAQLFGYENNASAFRLIFDLLMKIRTLWHEEAGTHPLLKSAWVRKWGLTHGLHLQTSTGFFLPPHLFIGMNELWIRKILRLSNSIASVLPWFSGQGGLLIIRGTKDQ